MTILDVQENRETLLSVTTASITGKAAIDKHYFDTSNIE